MIRSSLAGLSFLALTLSTQSLCAQPVIETFDRFEMNWTTMRLRYFGESASSKSFDVAEKEATDQGLLYALSNVSKIRGEKGASVDNASNIANAVSKQSYAYNTVYFSNGRVRVELESSLALALDPGRKPYSPKTGEGESDTGSKSVVIEVSGLDTPALVGEVVDSGGEVAYSSGDIAPEAYRKNLTGRWFYANSPELRSFAGSEPLQVRGSYHDGKVVVDKSSWDEIGKSAAKSLANGRVAFVLARAK